MPGLSRFISIETHYAALVRAASPAGLLATIGRVLMAVSRVRRGP